MEEQKRCGGVKSSPSRASPTEHPVHFLLRTNARSTPCPTSSPIDQLIGHTLLLELTSLERDEDSHARVLVKLEYFKPWAICKDRVAEEHD